MKKNLVLLGMMGVGKTTVGKIVAKKLDLEFIDTDTLIEAKYSMKISEIFKKKGEKFFRLEEEKEALKSLKKSNCVIALGGGGFMNKNIRSKVLEDATSIWLDVNLNTINKRTKWNKKRPLLNKVNVKKKIDQLYSERKNIYNLSKYKIDCGGLSKENISKKIITIYEKN